MSGKHRHPHTLRLASMFSLGVALIAAAAMLTLRPSPPQVGPGNGPPEVTLAGAYPEVKPATLAPDGYLPLFFLDEQRSLGTVPTPDGAVQLLLRDGGTERELRRLPRAGNPEFAGFTAEGERVVWLEITFNDGRAESRLWTLDSLAAQPRMVTADIGDVGLFDKRDDLVLHEGEVSWVSLASTGDPPQTEIRTVPLAGGEVRVDTREGVWSFVGWPWLTTVNLGQGGPIELRNLLTDERTIVAVQPHELMACSPTWCRSVIIGTGPSSTVIDLQNPAGAERFRSASGSVAASIVDVAVMDRYEVYSHAGGRLVLFDIEARRSIEIATGVGQVVCRQTTLWWSTGDNETLTWHALDLRRLSSVPAGPQ